MTVHVPVPAYTLMNGARWMMDICQRHGLGTYGPLMTLVNRSSNRAGGPAMRLARAVWAYDFRTRFGTDKALRVAEENAFAHLMHTHRDEAKQAKYRVWQAIGLFAAQREAAFGPPLLPTVSEPPLGAPDPLKRALYRLDKLGLVPELHGVLTHLMATNPVHPAPEAARLLEDIATAACSYATWKRHPTGVQFEVFQRQVSAILAFRYAHRAWVDMTPANAAIECLRHLLRTP